MCLLTAKVIVDKREDLSFYKFPRYENLKQWLLIEKNVEISSRYNMPECVMLLLRLKSRLEKDEPSTFYKATTPPPTNNKSTTKERKLTKLYFLPPPHRFSTQSLQYQNWKANKYSILTVIEPEPPVSESSSRILKFMSPLILNTNFIKLKS